MSILNTDTKGDRARNADTIVELFVAPPRVHHDQGIMTYRYNLTDSMVDELSTVNLRNGMISLDGTDFRRAILPSSHVLDLNTNVYQERCEFVLTITSGRIVASHGRAGRSPSVTMYFGYFRHNPIMRGGFGLLTTFDPDAEMMITSVIGADEHSSLGRNGRISSMRAHNTRDVVHREMAGDCESRLYACDASGILADSREESEREYDDRPARKSIDDLPNDIGRSFDTKRLSPTTQLCELQRAIGTASSMGAAANELGGATLGYEIDATPLNSIKSTLISNLADRRVTRAGAGLVPESIITLDELRDRYPHMKETMVENVSFDSESLDQNMANEENKANLVLACAVADMCVSMGVRKMELEYTTDPRRGDHPFNFRTLPDSLFGSTDPVALANAIEARLELEVFPLILAICDDTDFNAHIEYDVTGDTKVNVMFLDNWERYGFDYQGLDYVRHNGLRGISSPVVGDTEAYHDNSNAIGNITNAIYGGIADRQFNRHADDGYHDRSYGRHDYDDMGDDVGFGEIIVD